MKPELGFRLAGRASLTLPGGTKAQGWGEVVAGDLVLWGGQAHQLGVLPEPLCRFVGWLPELLGPQAQGAQLEKGGRRYRVLQAQELRLGDTPLGALALLERMEEDDTDQ